MSTYTCDGTVAIGLQDKTGIPLGAKIVAFRKPEAGEWFLSPLDGKALKCIVATTSLQPIIQWTHPYGKMRLEDVPIPKGWRRLAHEFYRFAERGEFFLNGITPEPTACQVGSLCKYIIVERVPKKKAVRLKIDRIVETLPSSSSVKMCVIPRKDGTLSSWTLNIDMLNDMFGSGFAEVVEVDDDGSVAP